MTERDQEVGGNILFGEEPDESVPNHLVLMGIFYFSQTSGEGYQIEHGKVTAFLLHFHHNVRVGIEQFDLAAIPGSQKKQMQSIETVEQGCDKRVRITFECQTAGIVFRKQPPAFRFGQRRDLFDFHIGLPTFTC